jgi:hypothetical protein
MSTASDDWTDVLADPQPHLNADKLEQTISEERRRLALLATDESPSRRAQALDHMAAYAAMLREAADASVALGRGADEPVAYTFKVEFADGRWGVEEKELQTTPRVGDVVRFADGQPWYVRASQSVRPRPSGKPARDLFLCAPSI